MNKDIERVLVTEEQIEEATKRLAFQINKDYEGKEILVIGLLKGCVPFMAKLISYIENDMVMDFMNVSSYHGTKSTNDVRILQDLEYSVEGRHIIIAEDIVDTGQSLTKIMELLKLRGAASIEVATLLDKPEGRVVPLEAKYVGVVVPNEFVVGFGLDYNEKYRNLPYVGILKSRVYMK